MRLTRFSGEIYYNYVSSMFVLKNSHEKLVLSQVKFSSILIKKFGIIFLFLSLFFIFFCNQLPFWGKRSSFLAQLRNRKSLSLSVHLNARRRRHNFYMLLDNYLIHFGSQLGEQGFKKFSFFKGSNSRLLVYFPSMVVLSNNFLLTHNLTFIFQKFPELSSFFKYCRAFLTLVFNQKVGKSLSVNYYLIYFFLRLLKFPVTS